MRKSAQLVLALDVDSLKKAKYFVERLYPEIKIFKIGVQLFTACGPKAVEMVQRKGAEVFLDLKFFDIPNTVANAVRQAVRLQVGMLTLHILGDEEMLNSAVEAARDETRRLKAKRPLLIGVTVVTSKDATSSDVLTLAKIGLDCGLDGVVCSAQEAKLIREKLGRNFIIVTPGIRPNREAAGDQRRIATAAQAIAAGANFIVVGRPVLEAPDPLKAVRDLI